MQGAPHTHTIGTVKRKGFTIIQLVIGMLIFAILTGIAFFGISVYTAQANETRVASDLGTFEVAIKDYMLNNPGACSDGTLSPVGLNHYLTKENTLALDEADPNKDDLGSEISVAAGVKGEAAYKKLSVLEDPWGHQYRVVIRNNADRTTEEGEYGAKGTDRAFIYVYSMGKDGKGAANDTKQDDSVLCVQYSDGEVYSRSYLPSDGKNQAIAAPAYTYWNKDENGKHSVMKDSIFAVGVVDPSKAPGKENGSSGGIGGGGSNVTSSYAGWYLTGDYAYRRATTAGNELGLTSIEEGKRFIKEVYIKVATGMTWDEFVRATLSDPDNEGLTEEQLASAIYADVGLDESTFVPATLSDEWTVMVVDKEKTSYGALEAMISGYPVTSLTETFKGCTNMKTAPSIPASVKDMTSTFDGCTSLAGTIEINANPTSYEGCFNGTTQEIELTGQSTKFAELCATSSARNVYWIDRSFYHYQEGNYLYFRLADSGNEYGAPNFQSVETFYKELYVPKLLYPILLQWKEALGDNFTWDGHYPTNEEITAFVEADVGKKEDFEPASGVKKEWRVIEASSTQFGKASYDPICSYIDGMPVTSMEGAFRDCEGLVNPPAIPETVTDITSAFSNCMYLTQFPVIPSGVKKMDCVFDGAIMNGTDEITIVVDANPTSYYSWMGNNSIGNITITGKSGMLQELAQDVQESYENVTITIK